MKISASLIRFVLEAGFLVLVAAAAGIARLSAVEIVLVMGAAWLLVALVERSASRNRTSIRPDWRALLARARLGSGGEAEPRHRLRLRTWARREPPSPPPAQPEADVVAPPPSHVRVLGAEPVDPETPAPEPEPPIPAAPPPPPEQQPELREVAPPPPPPPEPHGVVAFVPRSNGPRSWNLWDLERMAREREGADEARDEERGLLLIQLRQFASADGTLPASFDGLVRESFGEPTGFAGR